MANTTIEENESDRRAGAGTRSFARMFDQLNEGSAELELSRKFHRLCKMMKADAASRGSSGTSKGSIKLTLNLKVESGGEEMVISYDVAVKEPPRIRRNGKVWLNKDGNVSYEPIKQLAFPGMRVVEATGRQLKDDDENEEERVLGGDLG